jgi:hypothetical protein
MLSGGSSYCMMPMASRESWSQDLRCLPPLLRWPLSAGHAIVGTRALVGALAFLIHLLVFYTAFRHGAPVADR